MLGGFFFGLSVSGCDLPVKNRAGTDNSKLNNQKKEEKREGEMKSAFNDERL